MAINDIIEKRKKSFPKREFLKKDSFKRDFLGKNPPKRVLSKSVSVNRERQKRFRGYNRSMDPYSYASVISGIKQYFHLQKGEYIGLRKKRILFSKREFFEIFFYKKKKYKSALQIFSKKTSLPSLKQDPDRGGEMLFRQYTKRKNASNVKGKSNWSFVYKKFLDLDTRMALLQSFISINFRKFVLRYKIVNIGENYPQFDLYDRLEYRRWTKTYSTLVWSREAHDFELVTRSGLLPFRKESIGAKFDFRFNSFKKIFMRKKYFETPWVSLGIKYVLKKKEFRKYWLKYNLYEKNSFCITQTRRMFYLHRISRLRDREIYHDGLLKNIKRIFTKKRYRKRMGFRHHSLQIYINPRVWVKRPILLKRLFKNYYIFLQYIRNIFLLPKKHLIAWCRKSYNSILHNRNYFLNLIIHLEMRLINILVRLKFTQTMFTGYHLISNNLVLVNGNPIGNPSFQTKQGDFIELSYFRVLPRRRKKKRGRRGRSRKRNPCRDEWFPVRNDFLFQFRERFFKEHKISMLSWRNKFPLDTYTPKIPSPLFYPHYDALYDKKNSIYRLLERGNIHARTNGHFYVLDPLALYHYNFSLRQNRVLLRRYIYNRSFLLRKRLARKRYVLNRYQKNGTYLLPYLEFSKSMGIGCLFASPKYSRFPAYYYSYNEPRFVKIPRIDFNNDNLWKEFYTYKYFAKFPNYLSMNMQYNKYRGKPILYAKSKLFLYYLRGKRRMGVPWYWRGNKKPVGIFFQKLIRYVMSRYRDRDQMPCEKIFGNYLNHIIFLRRKSNLVSYNLQNVFIDNAAEQKLFRFFSAVFAHLRHVYSPRPDLDGKRFVVPYFDRRSKFFTKFLDLIGREGIRWSRYQRKTDKLYMSIIHFLHWLIHYEKAQLLYYKYGLEKKFPSSHLKGNVLHSFSYPYVKALKCFLNHRDFLNMQKGKNSLIIPLYSQYIGFRVNRRSGKGFPHPLRAQNVALLQRIANKHRNRYL